jgi:AcrR family transcriptional regulator
MPVVPKRSAKTVKIIEAAGKLFARQGYHGTTTRQIAQLAEVGENTIFRQFAHKEALFWSTIDYHSSGLKLRRNLEEGLAESNSPQVVLPKIIDLLTDISNYKPELLQMIAIAFLELHWRSEQFANEHLSPSLCAIRQYLETNMKNEKLRRSDPSILTTALMMTTLIHPEMSRLINGGQRSYRNSQEASHAYAEFWLGLLAPDRPTIATPFTTISLDHEG